jgi:predicted DNA-binding transcriptional regulator YafY
MPEKKDPYSSYGQKLIRLFAKLLFSKERHSLIDLSRMLNCSKQTVLRLVGDIQTAYDIDIEETIKGRRKYFRMKDTIRMRPIVNITEAELNALQMCRAFTEHLMGSKLFEEATRALDKSTALLPHEKPLASHHFSSFRPGSIDYTPHQKTIHTLIEAMDEKRICRISYKAIMAKSAKSFHIKPLKIFSHHDTIYLNARKAMEPGKPYKEPEYNPLLAIHRIEKVDLTDRAFVFPHDYDFEKTFNQNFGIIKEDSFEVEVDFVGFAARYVAERIWSQDQKIIDKEGDKVALTFSATSKPELISWVLSFGNEAKVIRPDWLVKEVNEVVKDMYALYGSSVTV